MYKDPSSGEGQFLRAPRPDLLVESVHPLSRSAGEGQGEGKDNPAPLKRRRGRSATQKWP